ncbi:MAG: BatA domain-containing protein [Planctomycetota bacterium]
MSFLNPILLGAGLAAVAIPILIHILMRRRRKPMKFAAMRFLIEAYKKQRRRMQLEQLILLALRCLLIALAALAIGRPLLGEGALGGAGPRTVVLVLDNSLTSRVATADGSTELDRSKAVAATVLDSLDVGRGDRAALILAGGPADPVVTPASTDLAAVGRLITNAQPTDSRANWPEAIAAATAAVEGATTQDDAGATRATVVLLSGFRSGSITDADSLAALAQDGAVSLSAITPAGAAAGNAWIQLVEPVRRVQITGPGASVRQVRVVVGRDEGSSAAAATATVTLRLREPGETETPTGDARVTRARVSFEPGDRVAAVTLALPRLDEIRRDGALLVEAAVESTDLQNTITADDTQLAAIELKRELRVGVVARARFGRRVGVNDFEPADWVRAALRPTPELSAGIEPVDLDPASLDAPRLAQLDAVVVLRPDLVNAGSWARLATFVRAGKPLIIAPPAAKGANTWPDALAEAIDTDLAVARDITEPPAPERLATEFTIEDSSPLALLQGELPALAGAVRVFQRLDLDSSESVRPLLVTETGSPIAAQITPPSSRGTITLFTTAIDPTWSELAAKPLFVPLMQELVRSGVGASTSARAATAGDRASTTLLPPRTTEIVRGQRSQRVAPGVTPPLRTAGWWRAVDEESRDQGLLLVRHDPQASETAPNDRDLVTAWLTGAEAQTGPVAVRWLAAEGEPAENTQAAVDTNDRTPWDMPLLALALAVGLAELILARYASHALKGTSATPIQDRAREAARA